jgi:hypothetical protein
VRQRAPTASATTASARRVGSSVESRTPSLDMVGHTSSLFLDIDHTKLTTMVPLLYHREKIQPEFFVILVLTLIGQL